MAACEGGSWLGFDGDNIIRNGGGAIPNWRYVHGPAVDDPLIGIRLVGSSYERYYYLTDGRGRLLAFTDSAGNNRLGDPPYQQGGGQAGAVDSSRSFENGRAESPNAPQVSFFRNRYYDQLTGRWTRWSI